MKETTAGREDKTKTRVCYVQDDEFALLSAYFSLKVVIIFKNVFWRTDQAAFIATVESGC